MISLSFRRGTDRTDVEPLNSSWELMVRCTSFQNRCIWIVIMEMQGWHLVTSSHSEPVFKVVHFGSQEACSVWMKRLNRTVARQDRCGFDSGPGQVRSTVVSSSYFLLPLSFSPSHIFQYILSSNPSAEREVTDGDREALK